MMTVYGDGVEKQVPFLSLTPDLVWLGGLALYHPPPRPREKPMSPFPMASHGQRCETPRGTDYDGGRESATHREHPPFPPRLHNNTGRTWAARRGVSGLWPRPGAHRQNGQDGT